MKAEAQSAGSAGRRAIVVGGGVVGADLAGILLARGESVTIVERQAERAAALRRELPGCTVVLGDGTEIGVLRAAGAGQAHALAAVTGADETNLVAALVARLECGVPRTVGRVNDPANAWMFTSLMGVDESVNQADLMAHLLAVDVEDEAGVPAEEPGRG